MSRTPSLTTRVGLLLAVALGLLAATAAVCSAGDHSQLGGAADDRESYGYVRVLEGAATIDSATASGRDDLELNQPVMTGDALRVERGGNVEVVLADRNLLRVGGETELALEHLAFSGDASDRVTVLRLVAGDLQLAVSDESLGDELPRIELPNGTVYVQDVGSYLVSSDGESWSRVTVREGYAELVTERGSTVLRADETATLDGTARAQVDVRAAGGETALERWARRQEDGDTRTASTYVDSSLAYSTTSLARYGTWVDLEGSWAWRPRVAVGWRPYWQGRWYPTPSGLTWVSYEPWGWVPYHYGSWCNVPRYGWVWRPGYVYSPAWVYWYWGNDWAGWYPIGTYRDYYGARYPGYGFSAGLYGWAGGSWGIFADWVFSPTSRICRRDQVRSLRVGGDLDRLAADKPYGLVTTETRGLRPEDFRPGGKPFARLQETTRRWAADSGRTLRDVTDFVARKPTLSTEVTHTVFDGSRRGPGSDGTPLAPRWAPRRPVENNGRVTVRKPDALPVQTRPNNGWATPEQGGSSGTPTRLSRPTRITTPVPAPPTRGTAAQRIGGTWATPEEGWRRGGGTVPPQWTTPEGTDDNGRRSKPAGSPHGRELQPIHRTEDRPLQPIYRPDDRQGWRGRTSDRGTVESTPSQRFVPRDASDLPRPQNERPPVLRLIPGQRRDLRPVGVVPTPTTPPTTPRGRYVAPAPTVPPAGRVAPPRLSTPVPSAPPQFRGAGNNNAKPAWTPPAKPQQAAPKKPDHDRDR